jgi:hypothetical protein
MLTRVRHSKVRRDGEGLGDKKEGEDGTFDRAPRFRLKVAGLARAQGLTPSEDRACSGT